MNIDELIHNVSGLMMCVLLVAMTAGCLIAAVRLMKGEPK